jgi:hypothetical protein
MEFDWPCKKLDLRVSRKNEAQDRKNWGEEGCGKRISKTWRIHKSQITGEGSFNGARDIVIAALN